VSTRTPTYIHVGFTNTGTTNLQRNFFSHRNDIFYAGEPFDERGGIFTLIRYAEDYKYDESYVKRLCRQQIYKDSAKKVVISDETLCDSPQLYYAPYVVPRDLIARRLLRLFYPAKIIFTIRNQESYVPSMYLNLKRNSAFLARMPVPPLSSWYKGMLSQFRCAYLQNLDFQEIISFYGQLFGRENILVLPLECLVVDGVTNYLQRLCGFMGLELSEGDAARFAQPENVRMSVRQNDVAELLGDDRFFRFYFDLEQSLGGERLNRLLDEGERTNAVLAVDDLADLRQRVASGNRLLADEHDLDLERYGYPLAARKPASPRRQSRTSRAGQEGRRTSSVTPTEELDGILEAERNAYASQIEELQTGFAEERRAVLARIGELGATLKAERDAYAGQIGELQTRLEAEHDAFVGRIRELEDAREAERGAYAGQISELQARLDAERDAFVARITELEGTLEAERGAFAARISELEGTVEAERGAHTARVRDLEGILERERDAFVARITDLEGTLEAERGAFIARVTDLEGTLEREHDAFVARIGELEGTLKADRGAHAAQISEWQARFEAERDAFVARITEFEGTRETERRAHADQISERQTQFEAERDAFVARNTDLGRTLEAERDASVARIRDLERTIEAERGAHAGRIGELQARSEADRDAFVVRIRELEETLAGEIRIGQFAGYALVRMRPLAKI